MSLPSLFESTLKKYDMVSGGERLIVACSGGADSVALFHLFKELVPALGLRLGLLHFDHQLRPGSKKDYEFVKRLALEARVPFFGGRAGKFSVIKKAKQSKLSLEEAARLARYEFFERIAKRTRIRKIALGHHRDDQAETVLMRLIQGTGPRGLQGIRPILKRKGVTYVRPLIEAPRSEIRSYLAVHSFSFREDATNRSSRFLRNRIRNHLLPRLEKEFNPRIREALWKLAETSFQETAGLEAWVRERAKSFYKARRSGTLWLDREAFLGLPPALQFRLLDYFVHDVDPASGLDFRSWTKIEAGLAGPWFRITLPKNLDFQLTPQRLLLRKSK